MADLSADVEAVVAASTQLQSDFNAQAPSFADQVLAAVQPVFEAAGWTAPEVESPAEDASEPADGSAEPTA